MHKIIFSFLLLLGFINNSFADEIKMAYLELKETKQNNFSVIFKVPAKATQKLNIKVKLPKTCKKTSTINTQLKNKAYLNQWNIHCIDGLVSQTIYIDGLKNTNTDLLLKLDFLNKQSQNILVSSENSYYKVPSEPSSMQVVKTYTFLGIEHILEGFDHLLFVFALLLIVNNLRTLIWTITAFTIAHSITLAGSSLGYISLPSAPVEAIIALSILFLAMEILHQKSGKIGIASRFPWIVSFTFGLLHGFGFAGALAEIGLPQESISLALLFFNVGVEIGQLIFVSSVLVIAFILKQLKLTFLLEKGQIIAVYLIGSLSSFWLIERISGF